jgi:hypothetical protein
LLSNFFARHHSVLFFSGNFSVLTGLFYRQR